MNDIDWIAQARAVRGSWRTFDTLETVGVDKRIVYRSELEPSFVCWAILWKEHDGTLKLSFTEVQGDLSSWPPAYDFNRPGMAYYLKTLVSQDGGETWEDTGWREPLDPNWRVNADHHIRHVLPLPNGELLRNYCRTVEGYTVNGTKAVYDENKSWEDFPFQEVHGTPGLKKVATIWKSGDKGRSWQQIYAFETKSHFFITGFHALRDGTIVAVGAVNPDHVNAFDKNWVSISESRDGGFTWTEPKKLFTNDDYLLPQGLCEEYDFVELDDGRLFMMLRTDGLSMNMLQTYLSRDDNGEWQAEAPTTHPLLRHSGYPYLTRASDGTIFFYALYGLLYSCDDGASWHELGLGNSYYGQITEASPGRMLAVTQRNVGDASFPYVHDTSMLQTAFEYRRIAALEQTDGTAYGSIAELGEAPLGSFHLFAEMRVDGESGIVFQLNGNDYGFAAVVIPCNEFRTPGAAAGSEQNAYLLYGTCKDGKIAVHRRTMIDRMAPSSWLAIQLSMEDGLLKIAVKKSADSPAKYLVVQGGSEAGKLGLFTNRSTGAFKNVRISEKPAMLRDSWGSYADSTAFDGPLMKEKQY